MLIHLIENTGKPATFANLCLRYGLLIFLPISTQTGLSMLIARSSETVGTMDQLLRFSLLGFLALQVLLLFGLAIIREDHQGIHEIVSGVQNKIKPSMNKTQSI